MRCRSCGHDNPAEARFCASCGSPLDAGCPSCGAAISEGARFCPSCGHPIEGAATADSAEERKLVTVLFSDLVGSTPLGERLDAEAFKEVTAEYFRAMRTEVEAEGGTVEKFIGDAIMVVFGVPSAHEDDPARALRAALRMRRRLKDLNRDLGERHGVELQTRMGVNTGEVIAVADPQPGEGMVAGDPVNVAARLEQDAEAGQIMVGTRTARATRGFHFGPPVERDLKGKGQPVTALPLLGEIEEAERGVPGLEAPLVGRDAELDVLESVWKRATSERRPHLVTVYGDAGVGKSRLTREFLERAETTEPHPRVLRGRCLPYGEGVTYWPLAEVLKSVAGVQDTDAPEAALERIRDAVSSLLGGSGVSGIGAALAYTVGLEDPTSNLRELPPREVRRAVHDAWRALFTALAAAEPTVLVIEDIHWADASMLDLLEEIADRVEGPLVILCPTRPELTDRRPGWGGGRRSYTSIALDPLTSQQADRLVGFLLDVEDLPPALHDRILERAEGNPFFLEEIVRQLIDEGRIVRSDGRWRASQNLADVVIPDTVQGVLSARIDLLSPEQKRTVQRAAVVGRVFWAGPVARLLNGEAEQVDDLLRALEDRELVASRVQSSIAGDREYMFKHILTRDVAYESLPRRDRGVAHATIAGWLEDVVGERKREFSELLAYHYLEAHRSRGTTGDGDLRAKAFEFLLLAADDARTKLVLAKARKLGADALDLAESPEQQAIVHELLGRVHLDDYNGDNAWYHWRTAADLRMSHITEDAKSIARICGLAIELPMRWPGAMGTVPEEEVVLPYLQGGLDRAGTEDSPELLRLLAMQCFWPFAYPDSRIPDVRAVTRAAGERALEMAKRLRMPVMQSATLDGLSSHTMIEGIYGPSVAMNEERRSLLPYLHDPLEVGDVKAVSAWAFHHVGRYAESEREASEGYARTAGESLGGSLHCLSWLGVTRARLGKWDELLEDLEAARTILGERRDHPPGFALRLYGAAGLVNEVRGDHPAADRCIRAVLEGTGATTLEAGQSSYGAVGWIALTYTRRGQFDLARAWLDKQDDSSFKGNAGLIWEARTDLVADAGWWDQAPEVVEHARAHAKEAGLIALPVFADRLEGRTAVAGGDLERGLEILARARDGFERLEARWDQALTALYRAEALAAAGRPADKNGDLTLSRATFELLGARRELQRANALT